MMFKICPRYPLIKVQLLLHTLFSSLQFQSRGSNRADEGLDQNFICGGSEGEQRSGLGGGHGGRPGVLTRVSCEQSCGRTCVVDAEALESLCSGSSGDIRSAVNSLQFLSFPGEVEVAHRPEVQSNL